MTREILKICFICLLSTASLVAQTKDKKQDSPIKLSGYVQGEYQVGEKESTLSVGAPNKYSDRYFSRMGIRRGRIKLEYTLPRYKNWSFVSQVNMTNKEISPYQIYVNYQRTKSSQNKLRTTTFGLRGGLDTFHFGLEPQEGSKNRLSPEYAPFYPTIFPDIDDIMFGGHMNFAFGAEGKSRFWHDITLQTYFLSGNGRGMMRKSLPDVTVDFHHTMHTIYMDFLYGASYYYGYVLDNNVDKKEHVKRDYLSLYARFGFNTILGYTRLSGEFLSGNQPGTVYEASIVGHKVTDKTYYNDYPILNRGFWGVMAEASHRIEPIPVGLLYKFYYYNKRDLITKDKVLWQRYLDSMLASTACDGITYAQGFGLNVFLLHNALQLTAYYEMITSERTPDKLSDAYYDPSDNRFTLRAQFNF